MVISVLPCLSDLVPSRSISVSRTLHPLSPFFFPFSPCYTVVEWFQWDLITNWIPSLFFGHLACKNRPENDVIIKYQVRRWASTHSPPSIPSFVPSVSPFSPFTTSLSLIVSYWESWRVLQGPAAWSGAEPQLKLNFMHFNGKICENGWEEMWTLKTGHWPDSRVYFFQFHLPLDVGLDHVRNNCGFCYVYSELNAEMSTNAVENKKTLMCRQKTAHSTVLLLFFWPTTATNVMPQQELSTMHTCAYKMHFYNVMFLQFSSTYDKSCW